MAGGHKVYMRQYNEMRNYRIFATVLLLSPIILTALVLSLSDFIDYILPAYALIAGITGFAACVNLLIDLVQLPTTYASITQVNEQSSPVQTQQTMINSPALPERNQHAAYHSELNKRHLSLRAAYQTLLIAGCFGAHRALLGKPGEMMGYCRVTAIAACMPLAMVLWITILNLNFDITSPWIAFNIFILFGLMNIITLLVLTIMLFIDMIGLPQQVAKFNQNTHKELAQKYLASTSPLRSIGAPLAPQMPQINNPSSTATP